MLALTPDGVDECEIIETRRLLEAQARRERAKPYSFAEGQPMQVRLPPMFEGEGPFTARHYIKRS